eukprot:IDg6799t1
MHGSVIPHPGSRGCSTQIRRRGTIGTRAEIEFARCQSRPGTTTGVPRTESTVVSRGGSAGKLACRTRASRPTGRRSGKRTRRRRRGQTAPAGELRRGEWKETGKLLYLTEFGSVEFGSKP